MTTYHFKIDLDMQVSAETPDQARDYLGKLLQDVIPGPKEIGEIELYDEYDSRVDSSD